MRATVTSYVAGVLFGAGLILSGMADPAAVQGFFDVFGTWNPSLAFVMAGGLAVAFTGYRLCLRSEVPLCAAAFQVPARQDIDRRLVGGSAIFGLGWGLVGYCPGPALLSAAGGISQAVLFTAAMLAGMLAWRLVEQGILKEVPARPSDRRAC
jgi:uncharacterized membrane protein YedE/YeeE